MEARSQLSSTWATLSFFIINNITQKNIYKWPNPIITDTVINETGFK